jgi:hypothetical protein
MQWFWRSGACRSGQVGSHFGRLVHVHYIIIHEFPRQMAVLKVRACDAPIEEVFHVFSFHTKVACQDFFVLNRKMWLFE